MNINEYDFEMQEHYYRACAFHSVKDPQTDDTSGNQHVINATHYTILQKLSKVTVFDNVIANSYIKACREREGIYNRTPSKLEHQAHDDYVAIACTSKHLDLDYCNEINDYGKQHFWYFDNTEETTKFEFKNWHGRFPWAVFTYKVCSGQSASLFLQLAFCVYLFMQTRKTDLTDTSGRILAWIQKEAVKGKYKLVDLMISYWEKDIMKKYEGGIGEILGIYHNKEHPFSKIMWGKV